MSNVTTTCHVKPRRMRKAYRSRVGDDLCPVCGAPKDRRRNRNSYYSYCKQCWNAHQRAHRPKYKDLSPIQRRRSIIRSRHNVYRRRGKILADVCFACGSKDRVELHHPGIDRSPDIIIPLCHRCHRKVHKHQR